MPKTRLEMVQETAAVTEYKTIAADNIARILDQASTDAAGYGVDPEQFERDILAMCGLSSIAGATLSTPKRSRSRSATTTDIKQRAEEAAENIASTPLSALKG